MSLVSKETQSIFRAVPSITNCFKNIRYNVEKINTDNLLRDNFEMFTVSQLHNAFRVVVQFARHCWLSLAAGIFLHLIERCCQKSVLLKTLQGPANKSPLSPLPSRLSAARAGPDCWKAAQAVWPSSKPGHFGNRHTQVLASLSMAWWGHLWGLGWVNTHDPRQTFTIPPGVQTGGRKNTRKSLTMQKQYDCLWWTPTNAEVRGRQANQPRVGTDVRGEGMLALPKEIRHVSENKAGVIGSGRETHLFWLVSSVDLVQPTQWDVKTMRRNELRNRKRKHFLTA